MKLCECGCGKPAPIARRTDEKLGYVKGKPVRFRRGHYLKKHPWKGGRPWPAVEERFWSKVKKGEWCWTWQAATSGNGYGAFRYKGKQEGAHRVSWMLVYGEIPEGLLVRHKCDNPICVRPDHLELGTISDNAQDMVIRNRAPRKGGPPKGERNHSSKLNRKIVQTIRQKIHNNQATVKELATHYGVTEASIRNVIHGKTWSHVEENHA